MPKIGRHHADAALAGLGLDRSAGGPLYRQLTAQLRTLIESGRLPGGARMPASRALAEALGISRTTALQAFEQLAAEGYLEGRHGAGTFVAKVAAPLAREEVAAERPLPGLEEGGPDREVEEAVRPFQLATPDPTAFPARHWSRLLQRSWAAPDAGLLAAPLPAGLPALRHAIAGHLHAFRGLDCRAANVVVTAGVRDAMALIGQALIADGAPVAVEEPGYPPLRTALLAQGRQVLPCPVDGEGLQVAKLPPRAAAVVVTPSRHYPLGATLPLARRLALLEWASARDAWVVEDDYDSEFRYSGQPIPPLAALDRDGRVLYVGSFSKVMFPSLRLGFVVAAAPVVARLIAARTASSDPPSAVPQPALATFIEEGGFARHLRRMRRLYQQRQAAFLAAFSAQLSPWLAAEPAPAGMHLVARRGPALPAGIDDVTLSSVAAEAGLAVRPLSGCYAGRPTGRAAPFGLLFGYAGISEDAAASALARLGQAVAAHCSPIAPPVPAAKVLR